MEYIKASKILYDMEEAARELMAEERPSIDDLIDKNIALMINRLELAIERPVSALEDAVYSSWACPSERATLLRCYECKVGDETVAFSASSWSVVNIKTRKIMRVRDVDTRKYTKGKYVNPFGSRKFKVTKEDEDKMNTVIEFTVGRDDLDDYGHMNNVRYLAHIEDSLAKLSDGTHYIAGARLHFIKEALIDQEIALKHLSKDDREYFIMINPEGETIFECEISIKEIEQ